MSLYLDELYVPRLRQELRDRGLDWKGTKAEIRERLGAWLIENGHDPEEYEFEDPFYKKMDELNEFLKKSRDDWRRSNGGSLEDTAVPCQDAPLVVSENSTEKSSDGSFEESRVVPPCCEELCKNGPNEEQIISVVPGTVSGSIGMESLEGTSDNSACVSPEALCVMADSEDLPLEPMESPDQVESSAGLRELTEVLVEQVEPSEEPMNLLAESVKLLVPPEELPMRDIELPVKHTKLMVERVESSEHPMDLPAEPVELLVQPEELPIKHVELPVEHTELVLEQMESSGEPVDLPVGPLRSIGPVESSEMSVESAKSVVPADVSALEITEGSARDFGRVPSMESETGDPVESLGSGDMVDQEGELGSGDVPRLKVARHGSRSRAETSEEEKANGSGIRSHEIVKRQSDGIPRVKMKVGIDVCSGRTDLRRGQCWIPGSR